MIAAAETHFRRMTPSPGSRFRRLISPDFMLPNYENILNQQCVSQMQLSIQPRERAACAKGAASKSKPIRSSQG
jgi:hypothetical protein